MLYTPVKLFIFLHLTGSLVWSEENIYVSLSGKDSTACGKQSLPCRTISYAIRQGSSIYLDGTNTSQHPYTCKPLDPRHPGNHLTITKSISFTGIKSRAHISCLDGRKWLFDGTKHKDGLQVNFHNLAFQSTTLHFRNTMVNISDSLFLDSKTVSMTFVIFNLTWFDLTLNKVVFKNNTFCILVSSTNVDISVSITNSLFHRNGIHDSSTLELPSILWVESEKSNINIKIRNSSFKENIFKKKGMISTKSIQATTNILLHGIKFEDNGHNSTLSGSFNGILLVESAHVILNLDGGIVYGTFGTFLTFAGHESVQVNVSNTSVKQFYSPDKGGGVFNILPTLNASLSIKHSCFCNGKTISYGSVIATVAPNLKLTIENSTIKNISNPKSVASIHLVSYNLNWPSGIKNVLELDITNSTFADCHSLLNGGVFLLAKNLFMTISKSWFERNRGGALHFLTHGNTRINLQNVHFLKNSANFRGIVNGKAKSNTSTFNFTCNNAWFVDNQYRAKYPTSNGILYLRIERKTSRINIKSAHFMRNTCYNCSVFSLVLDYISTETRFIALDSLIFRENIADYGSLRVFGQATLICKHSIFDSNCSPKGSYFFAEMKKSSLRISNSTLANNYCSDFLMRLYTSSCLEVEDSMFFGNRNLRASGGAITIHMLYDENSRNQTQISCGNRYKNNVWLRNVWFQKNIAPLGGALVLINALVAIQNCVFKNNFAIPTGGQITTVGSSRLSVRSSVLKQTIQRIILNKTEFVVSSFLRIYSTGVFLMFNTTIDLDTISNQPLILAKQSYHIIIDNSSVTTCPLGFNLKRVAYWYKGSTIANSLHLSCEPCEYNFYSLQRAYAEGWNDNNFKCLPCPRGAECLPLVRSKPNFWGYKTSLNPPTLAFTLCPFGYCKSPQAKSTKYNDCQGKRTGVMCGSCSDGYTEALWSTYCTPVKDCNDHWYWILFLVLVLFMAFLLVSKHPFIKFSLRNILWFKIYTENVPNSQGFGRHSITRSLLLDEQDNILQSSKNKLKHKKRQFSRFLEIIFYFYQIAKLLSISYSLTEFFESQILPPVLGFFNFEPRLHKQGFLCPFPGLTPKTKFAFKILPVFGTMIAIFIFYLFHVLINKLRRSPRPSVSPYLQASIKTIFLGYTTLATVGISLIRCVSAAGEDRWFYNGNIICFQWWQYVSLAFNCTFVVPFIFVLGWASVKVHYGTITVRQFLLAIAFPLPLLMFWLFRVARRPEEVNVKESENFVAIKEMLLGPYKKPGNGSKHGAIYWQSVLIARRFVLVLIFCTVTEPSIKLFCMTIACVFVLFFHLKVRPFRNTLANNLESLSLLLLVLLGLINLLKSVFVGIEREVKGPLVTLFKVLQWLEIVILGLYPVILSLFVCLATISLVLRALFICFKSLFKCVFIPFEQRKLPQEKSRLLYVREEMNC